MKILFIVYSRLSQTNGIAKKFWLKSMVYEIVDWKWTCAISWKLMATVFGLSIINPLLKSDMVLEHY